MANNQSISLIRAACIGREGNMVKRILGETDEELFFRMSDLAKKDIKVPADVYINPGVESGIAGFYVACGPLVNVGGFDMVTI